ncbi:MAG: hypothetical protein AMXMBFR33_09940 [Candidatus Xenobia bacterium]
MSAWPTFPAERASADLLVLVLFWVALLLVLLGLREEDEDELDLGRGRLAPEEEDEETLATGLPPIRAILALTLEATRGRLVDRM